ncbi:short-chain dehydrogenase/reductase family 42E member 1-like isoform X2 [Hibiscus syriacus]|uniref:Short-chain dehydrogenase/reductase family 42E member 1-like isoform X2 n=1 Tax=Hibiscus syriacus TaxID=106335 RepID=A0A6A2WB62_HIBSY|nr:short-chain dehydrogenase/reductase family 42E member 1-like [Hibiscus syriacus]KAE8654101.1 short-chain dehydrogenase/reductase family 42E member 1-like isoform X2 [Hibiscus syriacus]
MHLSENEGIEGNTFVVTGGLGFVGSALCLELVRRGARQVRAFDLRHHSPWSDQLTSHGVRCIQGDLVSKKDVENALRGAGCVFHLASYGMSGKEMLQFSRVDAVNINGTCHVLEACIESGITRLVYVSTYNVVYGGKEIVNGNEALPYFPIDYHIDPYGRSKSIAEQLVLKYNGRPLKKNSGKHLYTCAVRPAAIYGPGEERHFPRIVSMAKLGLVPFKIGDANVKTDWVYVDNVVLSLLLASMGLLDGIPGKEGRPVAAGQPYFISDGSPINSFDFIRPLLRSLDYDLPKSWLAVSHALFLAKIFWAVYSMLYPFLNRWWLPQPFILPAEVYKVGVTHYFSFLKAQQELGYVPMVSPREGMAATITYWQDRKRKSLDGPTIYPWILNVTGMFLHFATAWFPPVGPLSVLRSIGLFLFRSMFGIRLAFFLAVAAHIGEAMYAWRVAKRVDPVNARGWFWQTFALGFPSLRLLLKRAKKAA